MTLRPHNVNRLLMLTVLISIFWMVFSVSAQDATSFRVGMNSPVVLDPALHSNDPETALNRAIYDYLVEVQPDASIAPNLADSWTISEDGLTYMFALHEGVTFHDGSAFDSADVVWTFNRLKEVGSPALNLLGSDFTVTAVDVNTVAFTIAAANADFLYGVGALQALIIAEGQSTPNELVEGDNAYVNFNGTGPFTMVSLDAGSRAVFAANPSYWQAGMPGVSSMEHIYIDDAVAQVDALLSGAVDFVFKVPTNQIDRLEGQEAITVLQQATSQHPVIRLRADEGSLGADVRVRQALKFATDRDLLNEVLLQGRGVVGNNDPIAPSFSAFYDGSIENQPFDPAESCRLLTEADVNPLEATLYAPNAFEYPDLAALLQQMWAEACINVDIQIREEGYYYDVSNADNYFDVQLGITGWGSRPSPQLLLREAYTEAGIATGFNESRFVDAELEALVAQASATGDEAARREIYAQVSAIFRDRGPIIIPYFTALISAQSNRVAGLSINPFPGRTDFRSVTLSS